VRRYYYTLATLPFLQYEDKAPFSTEEFIAACRGNISQEDLQLLQTVRLEPADPQGQPFLAEWYGWEQALRNELVKLRAGRLGLEVGEYLREGEYHTGVFDIAREAFNQESPLDAETVLNRARWRKIEEMEVGRFFELANLIAFSLKLQLLLRKDHFTREQGTEKFDQIYQSIRQDIQSA
jgi:hypothetical protein